MQRALLFFVCFVCLPGASGCAIPYVLPKLDYTRALQLDAPCNDVRVYRVDIDQYNLPYANKVERLSELNVSDAGEVGTQLKPSVSSGIYLFMGALNYNFGESDSLALRAYRPGFELVKIKSREQLRQFHWIPVEGLAAQEHALDSLLPLDDVDHGYVTVNVGSSSTRHHDALLFGAEEYDRLASSAVSHEDRTRLAQKANKLRERAAK